MEINLENSKLTHNNVQEDILNRVKDLIPVLVAPLTEGFKYLGFQLKPNAYSFQDWTWLYKKNDNKIYMWTNRFLSRGGLLVLLKVVL